MTLRRFWIIDVDMVEPIVQQAISSLGTVQEAARKLGVSRQLLYYILGGKRAPSDKILAKLGLVRMSIICPAVNTWPEKGKSRGQHAA